MRILLVIGLAIGLFYCSDLTSAEEVGSHQSQKEITEKRLVQSKDPGYKAVELVKNHPTLLDPTTGKMRSVEKRMMDARQSFFPNMTWRYEAEQIRPSEFRVKQHSYDGKVFIGTREWEVDISTKKVTPSNLAAQNLYR